MTAMAVCLAACFRDPEDNSDRVAAKDPFVQRALDIQSEREGTPTNLLRTSDPVVLYLPRMTCVGLNLTPKRPGRETTMCFDGAGKFLGTYVHKQK